jgi:hypothetical protein
MPTIEPPTQAAEVAHAVSEGTNLLFLFAAPRLLASMRGTGEAGLGGGAGLASLRRFVRVAGGVRARTRRGVDADVERLLDAAVLVEEIADALAATDLPDGDPLPQPVVDLARRALDILGLAEPAGGWDAFEGFRVASAAAPAVATP